MRSPESGSSFSWKAHNNMALASVDIGELEMAEAHYRESLAIAPQPAIYSDLGFVLERQGLPEEAAEMYRNAIELDPGSATAHYNLAASLARRGEFAQAERHFLAALEQKPTAQAYAGLGGVQAQQGKLEEAVVTYRQLVQEHPGTAGREELARLLGTLGRAQDVPAI